VTDAALNERMLDRKSLVSMIRGIGRMKCRHEGRLTAEVARLLIDYVGLDQSHDVLARIAPPRASTSYELFNSVKSLDLVRRIFKQPIHSLISYYV
jgi:hypothetical protein